MNERLPKFKSEKLLDAIEKLTAGLIYLSETDAPVEAYSDKTGEIAKLAADKHSEEISVQDFFGRLTADKDWYGTKEKERVDRFAGLEKLLVENLRDLKVIKLGHIRFDIYVIGLDADDNVIGIKTKAVET